MEHLHQKIASRENTIDERLPSGTHILGAGHSGTHILSAGHSGTHILGAGHINDRTGLANAGHTDDTDHTIWATPDGCQTIYPADDVASITILPLQLVQSLSQSHQSPVTLLPSQSHQYTVPLLLL